MRDFAQLAVSAVAIRRLRARSPETAAVLLEIELLLLTGWDAREAVAAAGEGPVAARTLLGPALRRVRDALWRPETQLTVRGEEIDRRAARTAVSLLVEALFLLTAWSQPQAVEVEAAGRDGQLDLTLLYRAEAAGEPDLSQLQGDLGGMGGRLESRATAGGRLVRLTF